MLTALPKPVSASTTMDKDTASRMTDVRAAISLNPIKLRSGIPSQVLLTPAPVM
jgi:hypothetical protein